MEITNVSIQTNQIDTSRPPAKSEGLFDVSGKSFPAQASGQSPTISPEGQMLSISSNIDYIQQNLNAVLVNYPPFFPAGHPQRIDLIKGLKGIQEKIEKSAIPADAKKGLVGTKLSDNASDSDISIALNSLIHIRDTFMQNSDNMEASQTKQPGTVVNIKI